MIKDPSEDFVANSIKDGMLCWHFIIRVPPDTEFEGGLYHGIINYQYLIQIVLLI